MLEENSEGARTQAGDKDIDRTSSGRGRKGCAVELKRGNVGEMP